MYVCRYMHVSAASLRVQKGASDPLEIVLQKWM